MEIDPCEFPFCTCPSLHIRCIFWLLRLIFIHWWQHHPLLSITQVHGTIIYLRLILIKSAFPNGYFIIKILLTGDFYRFYCIFTITISRWIWCFLMFFHQTWTPKFVDDLPIQNRIHGWFELNDFLVSNPFSGWLQMLSFASQQKLTCSHLKSWYHGWSWYQTCHFWWIFSSKQKRSRSPTLGLRTSCWASGRRLPRQPHLRLQVDHQWFNDTHYIYIYNII